MVAAFTALTLAACGGGAASVPDTDTVVLAPKDVVAKVSAAADIGSQEVVALTTTLTGPVTEVDVRIGQPVQEGQIVARVDTSGAQRQLDAQRAQQMSSDVATQNELQRAQQQLSQQQDALNRGLNGRITQAEAAQREAQLRYDDTLATFNHQKQLHEAGLTPEAVQQANAVDTARRNVTLAGLDSVRANAANFIAAFTQQVDGISPVVGILESDQRYTGAQRDLDAAQKAYDASLLGVNADLEAKQRAVAQAFQAKNDADIALEVTRLAVQQEIDASTATVDQAQRSLNASQAAAEVGQSQLRVDIASGEVRSPINGVVTEVLAQRGQPSSGHLATVADPNRLILTANVNEVDSGKVQVGNEVTFTTPSSGLKQYKGKVVDVSSVAAPAPGGADGAGQAPARPEFPVTIEVTGDTEGLRIGGTAKVQITTGTSKAALTVPREAIIDKDGTYSVLVLRPIDGSDTEFEVASADVTLGLITDLEAEVRGLEEGTRVIKTPGEYRDRIGQRVTVGPALDAPEEAPAETAEETPAETAVETAETSVEGTPEASASETSPEGE